MNETDLKEWLNLASHDVDTAKLLIKENGHADIIIYHIHQAIEKMLKALLAKADKPIEKTHFLDKLLTQVLADYPSLSIISDQILAINLYLPKLRYPSGDKISFDEANAAFDHFQKIEKAIRKLV